MRSFGKTTLALIMALSGCAPLQTYYKEGETVARLDRVQTRCEVSALSQVPADIRTRYIPPTYSPYQICDASGNCRWYRHLLTPGRYEKYDANRALRRKVTDQCMADKGYGVARIKQCDAATRQSVELRATRVLPPLTENSCVIRLKSGRWQIVTPEAG